MSEWKEYRLSEIMELIGGTPKTTVPEYWSGNITWLSVTDYNTGKKYCFDAEKKITERGLRERNVTNNDFLYYLLKDNIASFHSASYGSVFDTITRKHLVRLWFCFRLSPNNMPSPPSSVVWMTR